MKKIILILFSLIFIEVFGHEQNVHRYIVSEAWKLLTYQRPDLSNSMMAPWIGEIGNTTYLTSVIAGAHNEDKQDIIYMNCGFNLNFFGINLIPCTKTTINHFWNADNGDYDPVTILGIDDNALQKAEHMWYGTHNFFVGVSFATYGKFDKVDHYGLPSLYNTGNVKWIGYWNSIGQYFSKNLDKTYSTEYRRRIAYDILGRICHLLADMSVPAHAHNDAHSPVSEEGTDNYEQWVKNNYGAYTWEHALVQGGTLFDVTEKNYPIRYLMYVLNQYADFFPSDGDWSGIYTGDREYNTTYSREGKTDYYPILDVIFNQLGTPPTSINSSLQASHLIPFAIRATASLLYLFANECDLIPPPTPIAPIISGLNQSPNPLYRGNSGTVTCNLSQGNGNLTYNWSIISGNTGFSISNTNSKTVSIHYNNTDAILIPNSKSNHNANKLGIEGPSDAILQCAVWNSAGNHAANVIVNLANTSHGCPFVYTWNGQEWIEDNNILPQSQQPDLLGQDVTDYYQLFTKPVLEDDKYYLAIGEFEDERSYLDQIKLLIIDHPKETFVTVDDEGQIIQFAKPAYFASAQLDSTDVIKMLYELDNVTVEASEGDTLYLTFDDVNSNAEPWILIVGQSHPIYKDKITGRIINKERESFTSFRLRRNPTYNWVLVPTTGSSSLDVQIAWDQDAEVDYTELCHKLELPFTVYEPQLEIAEHNLLGDVTALLNTIDEDYLELNKDEFITLTYSAPQIDENLARTFILVSRGRYERATETLHKTTFVEVIELVPAETKLHSNYPNPFNPSTMISYSLRDEGRVSIKVYDILGSEVATLVNESKPAGTYEVEFNASQLPSGVYIYRMSVGSSGKTGGYTASKKMLLVK